MKQLTFEFYNAEDDIEFMRTWLDYRTVTEAAKAMGREVKPLFGLARLYIDIPKGATGMPYIRNFLEQYDAELKKEYEELEEEFA